MPLYEYYCQRCDGVFEAFRPMREASLPVPCPDCNRDGQRIISASFTAFTMRDGYPRRIPDKGTYWHFGREVKKPATRMRGLEHPELEEPKPDTTTKGDRTAWQDMARDRQKDMSYREKEGVGQYFVPLPQTRPRPKTRTTVTPYGRIEEPTRAAPPLFEGKKQIKITRTGRIEERKGEG